MLPRRSLTFAGGASNQPPSSGIAYRRTQRVRLSFLQQLLHQRGMLGIRYPESATKRLLCCEPTQPSFVLQVQGLLTFQVIRLLDPMYANGNLKYQKLSVGKILSWLDTKRTVLIK